MGNRLLRFDPEYYMDVQPEYRDFRPGDVRHSLADISKARQSIGYEPQFSVTQGLDIAATWYMERDL